MFFNPEEILALVALLIKSLVLKIPQVKILFQGSFHKLVLYGKSCKLQVSGHYAVKVVVE